MPAIRFDHVSKRYRLGQTRLSLPGLMSQWVRRTASGRRPQQMDQLDALRDVDFAVAAGDSLALIGPNGAGKTTVMKLLAKITRPSSGTVSVTGRVSALIELGAGFHGELSGRDNVFLNGALLGLRRHELQQRFDDIVDFSGLARFIDTPVKRYSSGMIVRLGFAIASNIEPDVLLVDEVLAVGDAAFSQKCLGRIKALQARGTTLVFVSHNPYLIRASCRSGLYLTNGEVRCAGGVDQVLAAYDLDISLDQAAAQQGGQASVPAGAQVAITRVDVVIEDRVNPQEPVSSTSSAEIRVRYSAAVDLGAVQAAVFVKRADGLVCFTARSHVAGVSLAIERGVGTVALFMPRLQLTGGAYCVEAYLLDHTDSLVLTPSGAQSPWFTVVGQGFAATHDAGVFEPDVLWSQHRSRPLAETAAQGS